MPWTSSFSFLTFGARRLVHAAHLDDSSSSSADSWRVDPGGDSTPAAAAKRRLETGPKGDEAREENEPTEVDDLTAEGL